MTERRLKIAKESVEKGDFSHALVYFIAFSIYQAMSSAGLKRAPGSKALQLIKIESCLETGDFLVAYNLTTNVIFLFFISFS